MRLIERISLIAKNIKERDIYFFRKDLKAFKELISNKIKSDQNLSIADCIEEYNNELEELILKTNNIKSGYIYRYIALESLLNSRDYNSIMHRLNSNVDFTNTSFDFTGNLEHDYEVLLRTFYYSEYVLGHDELQKKLLSMPENKKIQARIIELEETVKKIKSGDLTKYDIIGIQKSQKEFFDRLRKRERANLSTKISHNILLKLTFLKKIGALSNYENEYNKTLEKLFLTSSLKIRDKKEFEDELFNINKLQSYSISELIALNAFWTNRLAKEVERRNEVIYVLENSNNFSAFSEGKEISIKDEDIIYYLSEYRALVPYITRFKLSVRDNDKGQKRDSSSNLYRIDYELGQLFSYQDINQFGFETLDNIFYNVLLLNNRSQLLYDQKDIAIEEMISYMANTKEYSNAGISTEGDGNASKGKHLIVIDLKGFNAPLMLHINKATLNKSVKKVSGSTKIPIYRGGKDLVIESSQKGKTTAKTNILFKLNATQRKDIVARAAVVGAKDTNGRYVTHIAWMLNPKKDMPTLISEARKTMDLETGIVEEILESEERKK